VARTATRTLKAVFADYGPASALRNRTVVPAGFELEFVDTGTPVQGMARMVRDLEFDVVDMSPTTFLAARSLGVPLVALPIAMYTEFPHPLLWCNKAANVREPGDLAGKNIGVRTWLNPAIVWLRGMLAEQFGVELDTVQWTLTVEDPIAAVPLPPNARRSNTDPKAFTLLDMVKSGEVDAVIDALTLQWHHAVEQGKVDPTLVEPLFRDDAESTSALYRRFGYLPVMHLVVAKRATVEAHADAVPALCAAFASAKRRYLDDLVRPSGIELQDRAPWLIARDRDNRDLLQLGLDPLPAGAGVVRTLDVLMNYMVRFGYLRDRLDVAAQFAVVD
jgi:4,5-dihydroxyphthalate decarboxylase